MTLISTLTATGSSSAFDFVNIPQTFTDLYILASLRSSYTGDSRESVGLAFNNIYLGYSNRQLQGNGSTVSSITESAYRSIADAPSATQTSNTFGSVSIYIPNYTGSQTKTASSDSVNENNGSFARQVLIGYQQTGISAITRVTLDSATSGLNWVAGSTASLYGILKGSGGATVS
jgi:hypothetical protein